MSPPTRAQQFGLVILLTLVILLALARVAHVW